MNEDDVAWINTVRIVNELGNYIVNEIATVPNDPNNAQYQQVQYWATLPGNVIEPYDPYYGMTVDTAKSTKYVEIDNYNNDLMDIANANPYVNFETRPGKNRVRVNNRNNSAANPNTPPGLSKQRDKAMIDYSDAVLDSNDEATEIVDDLDDVSLIMGLEIPLMVVWPQWFPPT